MAARVPAILSFGDTLQVPVILYNNTDKAVEGNFYLAQTPHLKLLKELPKQVRIPADSFTVIDIPYLVKFEQGKGNFNLSFDANRIRDAIVLPYHVTPKGFFIQTYSFSG